MTTQKKSRKGRKHSSMGQVCYAASQLESGFVVADIEVLGIPRCALAKAVENGLIKQLAKPVVTGQPGRPAFKFSVDKKGKTAAKNYAKEMAEA